MKLLYWIKNRINHKLEHFSYKKIKEFLKKNGLAFVIIFVGWEIIEDVVFPLIFGFLGNHIHPAFYAGIPASLILCFHWLAIPILWGMWVKINRKQAVSLSEDNHSHCCHNEEDVAKSAEKIYDKHKEAFEKLQENK